MEMANKNMNNVKVLTYNIMMLPQLIMQHAQTERAKLIPAEIAKSGEYDVVIFNEGFDSEARDIIVDGMRKVGYPYATNVIDKPMALSNGGVFVVSRHSFEAIGERIYSDSCGDDSMAAKGVRLVKFAKNGQNIYLAATHLQADRGAKQRKVREGQLRSLSTVLSDFTTDARADGGLVLITGDFNICAVNDADEFAAAQITLRAEFVGKRPAGFTSSPDENQLCKYRYPKAPNEWLDYILVSRRGVGVTTGNLKIHKFKSAYNFAGTSFLDLSDHYGLSADITMRSDLGTGDFDPKEEPLI